MGIRHSAKDVRWKLRRRAGDVDERLRERALDTSERVREVAWDAEERLLWRGSDTARVAAERALGRVEPLQRLIQTRLAWPLADAWGDAGTAMRSGVATGAMVAVAAASSAGAMLATPDQGPTGDPNAQLSQSRPALSAGLASQPTLHGVAPDFGSTSGAKTVASPASDTGDTEGAAPVTAPDPSAPPAQVAMQFAEAFVKYEVGNVDEQTAATFSSVAKEPLAAALAQEPPRLPAGTDVPEAVVLNVVVGDREQDLIEASVSLERLEAASELRLTLRHTPEGWQVVEVRG